MLVLCLCWNSPRDYPHTPRLISCPQMMEQEGGFYANILWVLNKLNIGSGLRGSFSRHWCDIKSSFILTLHERSASGLQIQYFGPFLLLASYGIRFFSDLKCCFVGYQSVMHLASNYVILKFSEAESVFISLPVKSISFIYLPMGGRKKKNGLCGWQCLDWHTRGTNRSR